MSDQQEKKPNIFLRLLAFLVTLALVLGALAVVVYRDRLNLDALKRWLSFRKVETGDTGEAAPFTHAGGDKLSVEYLEDGVVMTSASGVHYYSFSGEPYAEEVLTMENPVLCAGSRAAVAYDVGGQSLFVLRGKSETMDLSLDSGELLSARVNDSGYLAVTAQQSGYKGAVTLYNAGGEKVIQINLSSTFLVDAAPSPDGRMVAAVAMDSDGGSFRSRVLFYQVNQKEPSLEVSLGGSSVLDMRYTDSGLWVLGESSLMIVSPKDGSVQTYSFGRSYLKGCDLSGDGFALVLLGRYRAGSADQAITVNAQGEQQAVLSLGGQVLDFSAGGSYCAVLTGTGLTVYDPDMEQASSMQSTMGARRVDMGADGTAVLADSQRAWLYIPG